MAAGGLLWQINFLWFCSWCVVLVAGRRRVLQNSYTHIYKIQASAYLIYAWTTSAPSARAALTPPFPAALKHMHTPRLQAGLFEKKKGSRKQKKEKKHRLAKFRGTKRAKMDTKK